MDFLISCIRRENQNIMCASFTITCTLCWKQITPNDAGPEERNKKNLKEAQIRCQGNICLIFVMHLFYFHNYLLQQEAGVDLTEFSKCVFRSNGFMWGSVNMPLFGNTTALFMHNRMHRRCLEAQLLVCFRKPTGWMIRVDSWILNRWK